MVSGMCGCLVLIFNVTYLGIVLSKFQNLAGATLLSDNWCNCLITLCIKLKWEDLLTGLGGGIQTVCASS